MDFYARGQRDAAAFFKLAAPRWAKEIEGLAPSGQSKLLGMGAKTRDVRPLGHGGERVADLVAHPQHGLSVRKVPLIRQTDPRHVKQVEAYSAEQRQMEHRLKEIAEGAGPFTHILGEGPKGEAYYQFAPGQRQDADLVSRFDVQKKRMEQARKAFRPVTLAPAPRPHPYSTPEGKHLRSVEDELQALKGQFHVSGVLPPEAHPVLEQLKREYPGMHDIRGANIVGDRLVDLSPASRSVTQYLEEPQSKLPSAAISKRHYLGAQS